MVLSKNADLLLRASQKIMEDSGRVNHEWAAGLCHFEKPEYYPLLDELEQYGFIEFDYMGIGRNYRYEYMKTFVLTEAGRDY